jgi:hypothetical protein
MKSKITGGQTEIAFSARILNKYDINYYRCLDTGFIQTEEPYWLDEAYSSAITKLDIGMISRNELLKDKTAELLSSYFDDSKRCLDYAGGYGIFTRMMRDKGYDFFHTDIYCQNIFAEYFDLSDCPQKSDFELVTAFEVFEHLVNPIEEIEKILQLGINLLFTTELQPAGLKNISDWWYTIPETGQHVSLYTRTALEFIAEKFGFYFSTDGINTHLFSRKELPANPFIPKSEPYLIKTMRRKVHRFDQRLQPGKPSLVTKDFAYIKDRLNGDK